MMGRLSRLCAGLFALGTLGAPLAARADDAPTPALQAIVDGAKKEGALSLVWGNHILGGAAGAKEAETLINKRYGTNIAIEFTTGPSGPTIRSQILQELAAGQPSTTDMFPFADADGDKAWAVIDWTAIVPSVPKDAIYLAGKGVAFATPIIGITYNSDLVPADKAPKSLADLLKPEWRGKIATMPYIFGTQFLAVPDLLGEQRAMDFQTAFAKQIGGLIRCGEEDRIVSGEFLIFAVDCGQYEVSKRKARGQPLGWNLLDEGIVARSWLAGIPVDSAHPNAARLFVAFLLTPEGQDFVYRVQGMDSWKLPGSKTGVLVKEFAAKGTKVVDGNLIEADPNLMRIQNAMAKTLQQ